MFKLYQQIKLEQPKQYAQAVPQHEVDAVKEKVRTNFQSQLRYWVKNPAPPAGCPGLKAEKDRFSRNEGQ
jgi:hypothetical protein